MAFLGRAGIEQRAQHAGLRVDDERVEVGALVPALDRPGDEVVAQPEVERETPADLPVVLDIAAVGPGVEREVRRDALAAARDLAQEEGRETEPGARVSGKVKLPEGLGRLAKFRRIQRWSVPTLNVCRPRTQVRLSATCTMWDLR